MSVSVVVMVGARIDRWAKILRRWDWIESVWFQRRPQRRVSPEQNGFLWVLLPLFLAWPLEVPGLLSAWGLGVGSAGLLLVVLVVLGSLNALLLARYLAHQGVRWRELRPSLRWLCHGLTALPLLGFLCCPFLLRRLRRPSAWALRASSARPRLDLTGPGAGWRSALGFPLPAVLLRGFEHSWGWIVWLFGVNSLAALLLVAWLGHPEPPSRRIAAVTVAWLLHGLAALALARLAWRRTEEASGARGVLWRSALLLCLLPLPWAHLVLLPLLTTALRPRESSLLTTAFETLESASRLPTWEKGDRQFLEPHPVELAIGGSCVCKIAMLWLEAMLLGRLWTGVAEGFEASGAVIWAVLVALGAAGLMAVGEVLVRWQGPHYGRYLFVALAAAGTGFLVGRAFVGGDPRTVASLLLLMGLVSITLVVGWSMLLGFAGGSRFKLHAMKGALAWFGASCAAAYLGAAMLRSPELAATTGSLLSELSTVSPLGSLLLGWWLHPRLLKPLGLRQVLDTQLPRRFRCHLVLLTSSCLLPLGGLAAPYWLWVRDRLWPAFEGTVVS